MWYTIKVKEVHTAKVDMEANSWEEAMEKVKSEFERHPEDFFLEIEDTFYE